MVMLDRIKSALKPRYRFRSAITGQYVSRLYALLHPRVTIKERVK